MRKISSVCLSAFLFFSCTTSVDEVFDQSASDRLSGTMEECRALLTSAPNGWLIQYFPSYRREFGGYNHVAVFNDNGFVEIHSELAVDLGYGLSEGITSHYSLHGSSSVTLTFDTYNEYMHYFSDPDYFGMNMFDGDFEFVYTGGNAGEMTFKGSKTENRIVFTAIKEGQTALGVLNEIMRQRKNVEELFYSDYLWQDNAGNVVSLKQDDDYNTLVYPEDGAGVVNGHIPFIYTTTGIRFYEPVTFNGITTQYFDWDADRMAYLSADAKSAQETSASVVLSGSKSAGFISYNDLVGLWKFHFDGGESFVNVVLSEKMRGKTFTMTGLGLDVEVSYHRMGNYISLKGQAVEGSYFHFCPWDPYRGYLTFSERVGMNFRLNPDPSTTELIAGDNGVWTGYEVNGFLFYNTNNADYPVMYPLVTKLSK